MGDRLLLPSSSSNPGWGRFSSGEIDFAGDPGGEGRTGDDDIILLNSACLVVVIVCRKS